MLPQRMRAQLVRMTAAVAAACVVGAVWWVLEALPYEAPWRPLPSGDVATRVVSAWLLRIAALLVTFFGARRLGCAAWAAAAVTLGLAFSASFLAWSAMAPGALEAGTPAGRLVELSALLTADFGIPGGLLLGIGFVTLSARIRSLGLLLGWMVVAGMWALVSPGPGLWASVVLVSMAAWLVVAVGIQTLRAHCHSRASKAGVAVLVGLVPLLSLAAQVRSVIPQRSAATFVDRYLDGMAATLPHDAVIVAEGGLIDRRVSARRSRPAPLPAARVPQDPVRIAGAVEEGRPVVAFAGARRRLRELGFQFQTLGSAGVPMTIPELLATVPSGWIVALAAAPQFALTVRPDAIPTFAALGGTQDLFGRSRWHYGLIGVKGRTGARFERGDVSDIGVAVTAGTPLSRRVRAPVALAVRTVDGRAVVDYRGVTVASSATGIALAIVSPSGRLVAAYAPEFDATLRVLVNPSDVRAGVVTGREPCVDLAPAVWTDVSAVTRLASLGSFLEPGQSATVYLAAAHPLAPRQARLELDDLAILAVERFDLTDIGANATAGDRMASDGVPSAAQAALRDHRYVYRIETTPDPVSRRLLALRLGGFGPVAFARAPGAAAGRATSVCAAMRPEVNVSDLDLERDDLFLYGWNRVERAGQKPFRWTRARRAELVLPLRRPGPRVVSIRARPLDSTGMTVTMWVNDKPLEAVPAEPSLREYRWTVPEAYWRVGMNRLHVGVSKLARPIDHGIPHDDRLLGLAVERIRVRHPNDPF